MNYPRYPYFKFSKNGTTYLFLSKGQRGDIIKLVRFDVTEDNNIYNLSLGDLGEDGLTHDEVISNNGDRNKILATVVFIVEDFLSKNPNKRVFFAGLNKVRNRLFRILISKYLTEFQLKFCIYGVLENEIENIFMTFTPNQNFIGFLIKNK